MDTLGGTKSLVTLNPGDDVVIWVPNPRGTSSYAASSLFV